ncbi:MAG: gamma-glutamyltransferase [Proteobacteria bacterium]|nr:gamma-glutamyltransferase [Pseudomonadota bacterium]
MRLFTAAVLAVSLIATPVATFAQQAQDPIYSQMSRFHPVYAKNGMVASQERLASEVGAQILAKGGNAVDAAVAVGFALAVTLPRAGNIGGGGFMLVHMADPSTTVAIDYREVAPQAASKDMFLDEKGDVDTHKSQHSYLSVGVPGTVAGLTYALKKYGTMSLPDVMEPAINLAEQGFPVGYDLAASLEENRKHFEASAAAMKTFFKPLGGAYQPGEVLQQKNLALSLKQIAQQGPDVFYKGELAQKIVTDIQANGGLISAADMASYTAIERPVVWGSYKGYDIATMPPPSSGGVHLIQMLNMLETYPMEKWGHNSARSIHHLAEVMRLAYADRSKYLGDPAFTEVPVNGLTSKAYAKKLVKKINAWHATPSAKVGPDNPLPYESNETTHFSVMDKAGNVVTNTYTLNFSYGSGHVVAGTGILLNDEMDDFSAKPGVPNAYGLIGGDANAIAPGKRPLSSMTPVIVFKDGQPLLATGSPGGSRIITTVLQTLLNVLTYDMDVASASAAPRVHHQWQPDELRIEEGISPDTVKLLEKMGHKVVLKEAMGSTQSIMWKDGLFMGASDPRRPDSAAVGY